MKKFHPIWKLYEGTSFTKLHSGQKLWKIAQGAKMNGLSSSLVFMCDLWRLITLPNCSSIVIRNKALPLQNFREGRNLHWIMCQNFELWNMEQGWNLWLYSKGKLHNLCENFPAIKIVVPLGSGRNAILVLNRKRHFSIFNYGKYLCQSLC